MSNAANQKPMGYNERLFSGKGLRSYLHSSRFEWFKRTQNTHNISAENVIELGCFDGRLLSYCETPPAKYHGYDADWEGGLSKAQAEFKDHPDWTFIKSADPADLGERADNSCTLAVALETMEHIPPQMVDDYLKQMARITNGYLLISVPNEKGLVFLAKWIAKKTFFGGAEKYTGRELFNAVLGRMDCIARNEHKGFDYAALVRNISDHFDIVSVESIPKKWMPLSFAFTVGIVARSKPTQTRV